MCPSDFGIDAEITDFVVGRCPTTVAFYRVDDRIEVVECGAATLSLCRYSDAEIASRPLSVRILQ